MNDFTTVYAIKDRAGRLIALFMGEDDADLFANDYGLMVEEHYMPNDDPTSPWLMQ